MAQPCTILAGVSWFLKVVRAWERTGSDLAPCVPLAGVSGSRDVVGQGGGVWERPVSDLVLHTLLVGVHPFILKMKYKAPLKLHCRPQVPEHVHSEESSTLCHRTMIWKTHHKLQGVSFYEGA